MNKEQTQLDENLNKENSMYWLYTFMFRIHLHYIFKKIM